MTLPVDRRFDAYQQFVLDCKIFWSTRIYPELCAHYDQALSQANASGQPAPRDVDAVAALMQADPLYQSYAWLERHLQRMKYTGRRGLVPHHEHARQALEALLDQADHLTNLTLNPQLQAPAWYTAFDVHQHPGGVWGDTLAGIIYERGARSTTPLAKRHADLHERLTEQVFGRINPARLIDLGCGFGKSTRPFYLLNSKIEIVAVDLAEPCLRLAALTAHQDGAQSVRFVQADAAATGEPSASFDAVTSTMLLHEVPPDHLEAIFTESHRLLRDGGLAIHLDFLVPASDPFGRFIHYGHGERNNEPFMRPLCEMNVEASLRRAGFRNIEILPFEEAPGALSAEHQAWRFPWAMVLGTK